MTGAARIAARRIVSLERFGAQSTIKGGVGMLAVRFADLEAFGREFHADLSKGGIFVTTEEPHELRSRVEVGIELEFCKKFIVLEGEVVHCVSVDLASAGAVPGVAVQFDRTVRDLRLDFEQLLGAIPDIAIAKPKRPEEPAVERREARRDTARIVARVRDAKGERLEGMTRNLSATGVLFSMPGDPLRLGEEVVVTLSNPSSGNALDIPAVVMRHLEGEAGDVPAVGLRFCPEAGDESATQEFLSQLRDSEHARRLGGISGDIAELGLVNLLLTFSQSSQQGTISLSNGNHEGYIVFEQGALVATRLGRVRGLKALVRFLQWEAGRFEFHARIDDNVVRDTSMHLEGALLEATRQIDELGAASAEAFSPGTTFTRAPNLSGLLTSDFGKIESAILDLVDVGANVRKLLDVIPETDVRVKEVLVALIGDGILVSQPRES